MRQSHLQNKTVLITGCAKGLGRASALHLANAGATVIGHYHTSQTEAQQLLLELQHHSPQSTMHQADLRSEKQVNTMMQEIYNQHQRIDILINNVGSFIYKPFAEVEYTEFQDVIATNLSATFLCSKLVVAKMREQRFGRIINYGCAGADRLVIRELTTPYYIAKSGVISLTKIFAHTYASDGITVNAISPGILETSIADVKKIPAGRRASFDDILNALDFLLDPKSEYINGANIEVAGGWMF